MVGATGFEPATTCTTIVRSGSTEVVAATRDAGAGLFLIHYLLRAE